MIDRRTLLMGATAGTLVAGCGQSSSLRFKLSLTLNTPDGVKNGYSVCQIASRAVGMPARGIITGLRGEAVYVDCGPQRRPLVALLTCMPERRSHKGRERTYWSGGAGPMSDYFLELYAAKGDPYEDLNSQIARLSKFRGPRSMDPLALPDLVTFDDVKDPASVIEIDPTDLAATLGPGIFWAAATLEITDEPVTKSIFKRLPWLATTRGALDGRLLRYANGPFANQIGVDDFVL